MDAAAFAGHLAQNFLAQQIGDFAECCCLAHASDAYVFARCQTTGKITLSGFLNNHIR
jgi:hypothetical protein